MLALQRDLAALERLARGSAVPWAVAAENDVVRRALRDFIARHGRLGQTYIDLRVPDWSEQPGQLIDVIARRLEGPAAKETFDVRTARLNREADEHWRRARLSVPTTAERLRLNDTVRLARRAAWLTQEHCYWIDQMHVALMRRLALAVGARLRGTGCIDEIDDVFFLHTSEVTRLLRRPARRRSMVGERHAQLSAQEGSGHRPAPVDAVYVRVLKGEPGSPGIGRGPARLIRAPEDLDAVRPGDVLVCQGTNPSWVPFMAMACALVAESGGPLSHAAIIARELGIPAVVGVAGAMIGLRDGKPVEVDGRAGTVRPV
jgi:pyruvate,water dikinase